MCIQRVEHGLVELDNFFENTPLISSIVAAVDLIAKAILFCISNQTINEHVYLKHLADKSYEECFWRLIPIIGPLVISNIRLRDMALQKAHYFQNELNNNLQPDPIPTPTVSEEDQKSVSSITFTPNGIHAPTVTFEQVLSTYEPMYTPNANRQNLLSYSASLNFQNHAKTARIYYNARQLDVEDALRIVFQREPTNIAMGRKQYNADALEQLFGYRNSVYRALAKKKDYSFFSDLPNTVSVYSETWMWKRPGVIDSNINIACLSVPAPALDTPLQPHYRYYVSEDGQLDKAKYEEEMAFLFKTIERAVRDNKETAFNNKGIKRLVLCKFGQGAFLGALSSSDRKIANDAFDNAYNNFLFRMRNNVEIFMCKQDIVETAQDGDLIVNAWDPHSAPGNGNDSDKSFDGAMGMASGILLTQTAWLNEHLRNRDSLVPVV